MLAACMAQKGEGSHLQSHLHAAAKDGAPQEGLWAAIQLIGNRVSSIARATGLDTWSATFPPDQRTMKRVVEP